MQSKRNLSFAVRSSHSEQASLCLRQLHFYEHSQAFFSAFLTFMCTVLSKLPQQGTPTGRDVSVPLAPCQFLVTTVTESRWAALSAGRDEPYSIQCRTVAAEHQHRPFLNSQIKCLGTVQGKVCGSSRAILVPALQIYYYNIITVNTIKPPTIGLFIYCITTSVTPTTDSIFS